MKGRPKRVPAVTGGGLTPQAITRLERNVPEDLRTARGWVCWRFVFSEGSDKPKKVPINPENGFRANVTDPTECLNFEDSIRACSRWGADGVGFTVVLHDHLIGVDLDDCRDPDTGEIDIWAQEIIEELDSYTEVTPTGTGVRVWARGRWPHDGHSINGLGEKGKGRIEIYGRLRFFTVTGDHVADTPSTIERRQAVLDGLYGRFWRTEREQLPTPTATPPSAPADDIELMRRACDSKNGKKFRLLWEGNWEKRYKSRSEADMALCGQLAFFTSCDPQRMDKLFRQSGLFRAEKWDKKHFSNGETYGQHTIRVALKNARKKVEARTDVETAPRDATVCIADVESRPVEWLWRNWVPKGKLTLLVGDPGVGKSLATLSLAASVTSGRPMPDGTRCMRGTVLLLNAEDSVEDTVRPRLEAAEADLSLCRSLAFSDESGRVTVQVPGQLEQLREAIRKHEPALVVIDPIAPFLGSKIDSWKDTSVRSALAPLAKLAEETGTAIISVLHLNKKEEIKKLLYRPGASIGFVAASRSVLIAAHDKGDRYTLSTLKVNLARQQTPFTYRIVGSPDSTARIVWDGPQVEPRTDDAVSSSRPNALADAKDFLREMLEQGPQEVSSLFRCASESNISVATIRRAKDDLRIRTVRVGFGPKGRWTWRLPVADTAVHSECDE
jgi:putative DNA primase/helicase